MRGILIFVAVLSALPGTTYASTLITPATVASHSVWTKEGSPYLVDGDLYVNIAPSPLTIEAGAIVKFTPGSSIVFGENIGLNIQGTLEEPVYFTSLKDDSVGGDTNGDGAASAPAPGDWSFAEIILNRGNVALSHLKIRYAGAPDDTSVSGPVEAALLLVSARSSTFRSIESIEVSKSASVGARTQVGQNGSLTISNSSFFENAGFALTRDRIPNAFGRFDLAGGIDARNNWWGDASGPSHAAGNPDGLGDEIAPLVDATSQPILFDPWLAENPLPDPLPSPEEPEAPDPVIIIPGILGSELHNGEWVIDPILHTYDDLIATLDANGYTPDVDLFPFPYNWRKSNVETALLLKEKIDEIKGICECGKVDIVAHSMGGLVARQYIQSDAYGDDVDQLIFLGTPHLGAPKAYLMWEGGEVKPPPLQVEDWILKTMLEHEGYEKRYPTLFAYLRTEPIESVRELLSVEDYLYDENGLRGYPNNYPANNFLEDLNINVSRLQNSDVRLHNFVGNTVEPSTITEIHTTDEEKYTPLWLHGYPTGFYDNSGNPGLVKGEGDGTVPLTSASYIANNLSVTPHVHNALPTKVEGNVYQILTGKVAGTLIERFINIPNFKIIIFKILSPADLLIVAPDGKKIGKDFNSQEINEIENAFYTGFDTDTEFLTILNPLDGDYKIFTQGTREGSYTVETSYISKDQVVDKSFTGNTNPGLFAEFDFALDNDAPEDSEILPADTESPVITIAQPESKDYLRSEELSVDVSAEDEGSGIFVLETYFDGEITPNEGTVDLFFKTLGSHTILATSTDNVGNAASTTRQFRVIATPDSTLADFERVKKEGWMNNLTHLILKAQFKTYLTIAKKLPAVFKKSLAPAMLRQLDQYRGKGLNEQGYQLLKADIEWLMNN